MVNEMVPILMLVGLFAFVCVLEDLRRSWTMIKGIHSHFKENKKRLDEGDPEAKEGLDAVFDYVGLKQAEKEEQTDE